MLKWTVLGYTNLRSERLSLSILGGQRSLSRNKSSPNGFTQLSTDKSLQGGSPLRHLNPSLDSDGLLRVGGRLPLSQRSPMAKFPIIHNSCYLARLLIEDAHRHCLRGSI